MNKIKVKRITILLIPNEFFARYLAYLSKRGISTVHQGQYKKWLRYYPYFKVISHEELDSMLKELYYPYKLDVTVSIPVSPTK